MDKASSLVGKPNIIDLKILRKAIRSKMDRESISEVLVQLGYEFQSGNFCIRDEKNPSATVFDDGWIFDHGDRWHGDIINLMHDRREVPLKKAVLFVCEIMKIPTNGASVESKDIVSAMIEEVSVTKTMKQKKAVKHDQKKLKQIAEDLKQWQKNPQTFQDKDYREEALAIAPMWVWKESSKYARDFFRAMVVFDGEVFVLKIKNYDGKLISYKKRRDGAAKWKPAYGTHPNGQCLANIKEEGYPVYIVEGHHDFLTAVLLGMNVLMIPTKGYRVFTNEDLSFLKGRDVYLIPDLSSKPKEEGGESAIETMRILSAQIEDVTQNIKIVYLDDFLKQNDIAPPGDLDLSDAVMLWTDRDKGFKGYLQYFSDEGIHHEGAF